MACLQSWYPPLARALQLHPSITAPWLKPPIGRCPCLRGWRDVVCWEQGRGGPTGEHPRGQRSACAGRKERGVGKECGRAGSRAAGRWGAPRVSARIPLFAAGGWYKGPRFSRLREDRMIFTSSLAAFAHLWGTCPPQLSRSTRGSRMGLGGWLRSRDGPRSARGSAQRQPDPSGSVSRYTREEGTKHPCWIWGEPRRVGA